MKITVSIDIYPGHWKPDELGLPNPDLIRSSVSNAITGALTRAKDDFVEDDIYFAPVFHNEDVVGYAVLDCENDFDCCRRCYYKEDDYCTHPDSGFSVAEDDRVCEYFKRATT